MKPVSGRRMCRALERRGWVHTRTNGSHFIDEHPDAPLRLAVPVHGNRDLAPPTQRRLMRAAGLTDADL